MQRRDFLKTSLLSSGIIYSSGIYAMEGFKNKESGTGKMLRCHRPGCQLPVIFDVDLLVAGGSAAGVAAAVEASRNGAKVVLVTPDPYLGWDICGTLNLWDDHSATSISGLAKKLFKQPLPLTPLKIKRLLDEQLITNQIPFIYSSFISSVLENESGKLAGVVVANRSGEQIIRCKMAIDATKDGTLLRAAGIKLNQTKRLKKRFHYTVIGENPDQNIPHIAHSPGIRINEKTYQGITYHFENETDTGNLYALARLEQEIRSKIWEPDIVDTADYIQFIPNEHIDGKQSCTKRVNVREIDPECFIPKENEQIYALNQYAHVSRDLAEELLSPVNLISIGERIGIAAGLSAKSLHTQQATFVKNGTDKFDILLHSHTDKMRDRFHMEDIILENETLPVLGEYDVAIMGGGTAGAGAGIGAARSGAKTIILEYMHGLGGTGTLGQITKYYHGYREGFTHEVDTGVKELGGNHPRKKEKLEWWVRDWKMEWFRKEYLKAGGELWFGVLGCGAVMDGNTVKGIVVATPFGKGIVLAKKVVDSTGSGDIAIAAGADYQYTDGQCLAIQGAGLPFIEYGKDYINTDWTFINDSDVFDITRTFVAGHSKYKGHYDVGKLLQTRERRRVVCDYEISVLDVYNNRTFHDVVSFHKSSFDTHGFTVDPFFTLKPPKGSGIDETASVPLRAMLPKGLENIIVTGLGIGAHRDAMPVIRMQPCLQNQGYAVGILARMAIDQNATFREAKLDDLQKKLIEMGNLPAEIVNQKDHYPPGETQINEIINKLDQNLDGLELLLWDFENNLSLIKSAYQETNIKEKKLILATILGLHGYDDGWEMLAEKIAEFDSWDEGWNYTGMGQFGRSASYLDGLIMALGRTRRKESLHVIHQMANKLTQTSEFSHFRAIAIALENIKSTESTGILANLLNMPGVSGYDLQDLDEAAFNVTDSTVETHIRNLCLRELVLGRALYRCGDKNGLGKRILKAYSGDLRGHYSRHAMGILAEIG